MSFVRVEQRNARLATVVRLDQVKGREGPVTKGTVVVISNARRGDGREEEATSIQWTLWGKQAENAAEFLGKGSRVNVVGRLQNNNYEKATGEIVYGLNFNCEEIDFLESRAEVEARVAREHRAASGPAGSGAAGKRGGSGHGATRTAGAMKAIKTVLENDIPF